jgi:DNA-binding transcriptional ArsR family regulator
MTTGAALARSSVGQHTGVLRDARLIRTSRAGRSVLHTLTPLGRIRVRVLRCGSSE